MLSVALTGRLGWIAYGPQPGPDELRDQTAFPVAAAALLAGRRRRTPPVPSRP